MNTKPLRLLLHDGTGQYIYGTEDDMRGPEILDDVTGNAEHEAAAKAQGVTLAKALADRRHAPILAHQTAIVNAEVWRTCLNCLHWIERTTIREDKSKTVESICGMFGAVPPPHIIVHGCRDHENDIPF